MIRIAFLILCAIAIGVGRFFVSTHALSLSGTYEALAHLFVGGLIGAWLVGMSWQRATTPTDEDTLIHPHQLYLFLLVALTALEVYAFMTK